MPISCRNTERFRGKYDCFGNLITNENNSENMNNSGCYVMQQRNINAPNITTMTNEETRQLAGVVAKTRALFEANRVINSTAPPPPPPPSTLLLDDSYKCIKKRFEPHNQENRITPLHKTFKPVNKFQHDSDDQTTKSTAFTPIMSSNSRRQKQTDTWSTPTLPPPPPSSSSFNSSGSGSLWSPSCSSTASSEANKDLNLPKSVKQAKLCFENLAAMNSCSTTPSLQHQHHNHNYSNFTRNNQSLQHSSAAVENSDFTKSEFMNRLNNFASLSGSGSVLHDRSKLTSSSASSAASSTSSSSSSYALAGGCGNSSCTDSFSLTSTSGTIAASQTQTLGVGGGVRTLASTTSTGLKRFFNENNKISESIINKIKSFEERSNSGVVRNVTTAMITTTTPRRCVQNESNDQAMTMSTSSSSSGTSYTSLSSSSRKTGSLLPLQKQVINVIDDERYTFLSLDDSPRCIKSEEDDQEEDEEEEHIQNSNSNNNKVSSSSAASSSSSPLLSASTSPRPCNNENKSSSSPKLNPTNVRKFLSKFECNAIVNSDGRDVDDSSCVLPSKLRMRNLETGRVSVEEKIQKQTVVQTEVTAASFKSRQGFFEPIKQTNIGEFHTRVSNQKKFVPISVVSVKPSWKINSSNGFVKNNAAIFNRQVGSGGAYTANVQNNSNNNSIVAKKVNRNAATAREALLRWCRKMTEDYENVSIENFSSSWSNGLAFCALINHFLPDSFDYSQLDARNPRENFHIAFKIAEEKADIVSLLDVDDMIEMGNSPDWKCVFTYVHSIYSRFKEIA